MKKILASLFALTMVASMSVTAFAATELETSPADGKSEGSYSIAVTGKYVPGSNSEEKISVDIAWEKMEFTYTAGGISYSPDTHKTTTTTGGWNADKKTITVTNHSNVDITADFTFTQGNGVTTTGSFYDSAEATTALATDKQSFTLVSGEDKTTAGQNYTVPSSKIYFGVSGDAIDADKALGTITVKIEKAVKVITTVEDFNNAFATGGKYKMANDILEVGDVSTSKNVTLDMNGYRLACSSMFGALTVKAGGVLTVTGNTNAAGLDHNIEIETGGKLVLNSGKYGTGAFTSRVPVLQYGGELILKGNVVLNGKTDGNWTEFYGGKIDLSEYTGDGIVMKSIVGEFGDDPITIADYVTIPTGYSAYDPTGDWSGSTTNPVTTWARAWTIIVKPTLTAE